MNWRDVAWRAVHIGRRVLSTQVSTTEAAGLLHGMASVGPSFDKSLLPRTTIQQAGATGVMTSVSYGITATSQSFVEAFADRVVGPDRAQGVHARRAVIVAADLAFLAAGLAAMRILKQRPSESLWRATARTTAFRMVTGAGCGAIAVTTDGIVDTAIGSHTPGTVNAPAVMAVGASVGAGMHLARSRRLLDTAAETDQYGSPVRPASLVQPARAVIVGGGVSVGLYLVSRCEGLVATGIGRTIGWAIPALAPASRALGHAAALGGMAIAIERAIAFAYSRTEQFGNAIEPAYRARPVSEHVSGGPNSDVDWDSIGREGRRFVNMALTPDEISWVTQDPAIEPVRVFVGYESAESPNARAYLAMEELDRLGAFQRPYIAVFSPTGSGYVNYVASETVEFLTGGNVASVCIQYSVRPSFLSLDRVGTAWETMLAFLTALAWRIRSMPAAQRPKVLLFGESLGSQSAQDVFEKEGVQGFEILDIHRALFVGSPYGSKWRRRWLRDARAVDPGGMVVEVQGAAEYEALSPSRREAARVVLLTHNNDPIPKFGPALAIQKPEWLGDPDERAPGIPKESRWWPLFSFVLVGIDLLNADNVTPGTFEAWAHDYRKDIPQIVRLAFDLPAYPGVMERVERALRKREMMWAERRVVADNLDKAEKKVRATLEEWGVDHTVIPNMITPQREIESDPFEAATPV
jgi:uncharacterized membrane protein